MTPEQLMKLAEIAGLKYNKNKGYGYYFNPDMTLFFNEVDWQPHVRIEQAMMVAESFAGYEIGKNIDAEFPYPQFYCQLGRFDIGMIAEGQGQTLSEAICAAALAVHE